MKRCLSADIEGLGLHCSKHCQTVHVRGDNERAEFRLMMQTHEGFNLHCKLLAEIGLLLHTDRAPSPDIVTAQKTANPSQLISHVFSPTTCGMSFDLHSELCGGEHCHTIVQKNEIAVMSAKFCTVRSFDASFWKPLFEDLPFEDPKHPFKASPSKPPSEACLRSHLRRSPVKPSLETLLAL